MQACSAHFLERTGGGAGQPYLRNFPEEWVEMHEGSAGRDYAVFRGNCLGDWQPKLRNSQRELKVGYWGHCQPKLCNS